VQFERADDGASASTSTSASTGTVSLRATATAGVSTATATRFYATGEYKLWVEGIASTTGNVAFVGNPAAVRTAELVGVLPTIAVGTAQAAFTIIYRDGFGNLVDHGGIVTFSNTSNATLTGTMRTIRQSLGVSTATATLFSTVGSYRLSVSGVTTLVGVTTFNVVGIPCTIATLETNQFGIIGIIPDRIRVGSSAFQLMFYGDGFTTQTQVCFTNGANQRCFPLTFISSTVGSISLSADMMASVRDFTVSVANPSCPASPQRATFSVTATSLRSYGGLPIIDTSLYPPVGAPSTVSMLNDKILVNGQTFFPLGWMLIDNLRDIEQSVDQGANFFIAGVPGLMNLAARYLQRPFVNSFGLDVDYVIEHMKVALHAIDSMAQAKGKPIKTALWLPINDVGADFVVPNWRQNIAKFVRELSPYNCVIGWWGIDEIENGYSQAYEGPIRLGYLPFDTRDERRGNRFGIKHQNYSGSGTTATFTTGGGSGFWTVEQLAELYTIVKSNDPAQKPLFCVGAVRVGSNNGRGPGRPFRVEPRNPEDFRTYVHFQNDSINGFDDVGAVKRGLEQWRTRFDVADPLNDRPRYLNNDLAMGKIYPAYQYYHQYMRSQPWNQAYYADTRVLPRYYDVYIPDYYPVPNALDPALPDVRLVAQQNLLLNQYAWSLYAADIPSASQGGGLGFLTQGGVESSARGAFGVDARRCITFEEQMFSVFSAMYWAQAQQENGTARRVNLMMLPFYAHYSSADFPGCVSEMERFMRFFSDHDLGRVVVDGNAIEPNDGIPPLLPTPQGGTLPQYSSQVKYFCRQFGAHYYLFLVNMARNNAYEPQDLPAGFELHLDNIVGQIDRTVVERLTPTLSPPATLLYNSTTPDEIIVKDAIPLAPLETRIYRFNKRPILALQANTMHDEGSAVAVVNHSQASQSDSPSPSVAMSVTPNPASQHAEICFETFVPQHILITITDNIGRVVATPLQKKLPAGSHRVPLDLKTIENGLYSCILQTGQQRIQKNLVIVK
jgi:hypothetical protein